MKYCVFTIALSGILLLAGTAVAEEETVKKATRIMESSPYITKATIAIDGPELTVKLRTTFIESRLLHGIRSQLVELADAVDVARIRLELYEGRVPLFRFSLDREELLKLRDVPQNQMDWLDRIRMEDIRPIERVVADDLQVFTASVHSVKVTEDETMVLLAYRGDRASLAETFVAMILTVVEDTPWVKEVTLIFTGQNDTRQRLSVSVENFLALLKEEKSPVAFFESIAHGEVPAIARNEVIAPSDAPATPTSEKDIDAVTPQPEPSASANIVLFVVIGIAVAVLLGVFLFVRKRRKKDV